jgi:hypothetical protein
VKMFLKQANFDAEMFRRWISGLIQGLLLNLLQQSQTGDTRKRAYFMKSKFFPIVACILLILPALLWATDISGRWKAETPGRQGNVELTLTFRVVGDKLTGTLDNPEAGSAEIKDGRIEGDNVSFHLDRNVNGMEMKIIWNGRITGADEIRFKRTWEMSGGFGGASGEGNGEAAGGRGAAANDIVARRVK